MFMNKMILAVILLTCTSLAHAEAKIVFLNKCPDLPAEAFIPATNKAEWDAKTVLWACLNETQAAQSSETKEQVQLAIKNTKFKKNITIYSVDPRRPDRDTWEFGAWLRNGKVYFSAMPGCPNGRRVLEKLLRRLK
jgi:hypothetical protein